MTITGVDCSHWNTASQVSIAIDAGASFVVVKATDGLTGDDPSHAAFVTQVVGRGVTLGHYHFASTCAQAPGEAGHFLDVAQPQPGDIVALDLEAMDGNWSQRVVYALAWLHLVEVATGGLPWRYMNKSWLFEMTAAATAGQRVALDRYPLWIATASLPAGQPGVNGWAVHQWSTAGGIDHDVLAPNQTLADLTIPGADVTPAEIAAVAAAVRDLLATDQKFLANVANSVWNSAGGHVGDPSFMNQAVANVTHSVVNAIPAGGGATPQQVQDDVTAALSGLVLVPKP